MRRVGRRENTSRGKGSCHSGGVGVVLGVGVLMGDLQLGNGCPTVSCARRASTGTLHGNTDNVTSAREVAH